MTSVVHERKREEKEREIEKQGRNNKRKMKKNTESITTLLLPNHSSHRPITYSYSIVFLLPFFIVLTPYWFLQVLTAAHCGSPTRVEIGRYDRGEAAAEMPQYESRDVAYAYRHPHYDKPTYGYDLLLLKLVSPTFQKPPIKLNTQDPNVLLQKSPPQFVTVTGFGQTRHNGLPAPQLQYIDLNYISNGQCDQSRDPTSPRPEFQVGYVGMIQPDMLCLQDLSFSYKDACSGTCI